MEEAWKQRSHVGLSGEMLALADWARAAMGAPFAKAVAVADAPWSKVVRIHDGADVWFAKHPAPGLRLEAKILAALCGLGCDGAPPPVAARDALRGFFLTPGRGRSLRSIQGEGWDAGLAARGIGAYRALQAASSLHGPAMIDAGAPDCSPGRWLGMLAGILGDAAWLRAHGVDPSLAKAAAAMEPALAARVRELEGFGLPMGLDHGDLHEGNLVVDARSGSFSVIDLGEAAWGHPLMSLGWCVERTLLRRRMPESSARGQALRAACFSGWGMEPGRELAAEACSRSLLALWRVLGQERLLRGADPEGGGCVPGLGGRLGDAIGWLVKGG